MVVGIVDFVVIDNLAVSPFPVVVLVAFPNLDFFAILTSTGADNGSGGRLFVLDRHGAGGEECQGESTHFEFG